MKREIQVRGQHLNRVVVLTLLGLSLPILPMRAHQGTPPQSLAQPAKALSTVQQLVLPPTDIQAELKADSALIKPGPFRFAVARNVKLTPLTAGTWEYLPNGRLWRFRVQSAGATDMNFGFTSFQLPQGSTLHIISESEGYYQGPYTSQHNAEHGQLWTPVVPGDAAVLELFVPNGMDDHFSLVLSQVGTGYRDLFHRKDLSVPKAGSCEIDAVCPQAAAWQNEVRSAVAYTLEGQWTCSGTLIMDTVGDFRPFLLTANHCTISTGNAASLVAYWNYQSPSCGMHGLGGSLAQNTSGSTFRAAKADVDFCLVELSTIPDASYNVYYAGWDRSGTPASSAVGVHHPNCDGTCVSFSSGALSTINSCIGTGGVGTHWRVPWGTQGVTEPGSSGSGIWNAGTHLLVGTLSGGPSSCTAAPADLWDCYGKFSVSWDSGNTPATRLKDWLDPCNSGILSKAGSNPLPTPRITIAGNSIAAESCQPPNGVMDPGETVTVYLTLRNQGTLATANLLATLLPGSGVTAPGSAQSFGAISPGGADVSQPFTFVVNTNCGSTIAPTFHLQDGTNDLCTVSFTAVVGNPNTVLSENFDGVTAPDLPAGWTSSTPGYWYTSPNAADTPPYAAFSTDYDFVSDQSLISPSIPITSAGASLTFRHNYDLEPGYDGGVLEIAYGAGTFSDILAAGGSFVEGGYDDTIPTNFSSPIGGRQAWTGNSGGFRTTTVNLPAASAGQNVRLRWRLASDDSYGATGWYVDSVSVIGGYSCCLAVAAPVLSSPTFNANQFQLNVSGTPGASYAVEASTNLLNWVRVTTNASPFTFTEPNPSSFLQRYYRAVHQ